MNSLPDDDFYSRLPAFDNFDAVTNVANYSDAPESWMIVLSDVQGSTKAIEAGRYKDVNVVGAATIMAVLNAVKGRNIPYVFGGDGATMLIPESMKEAVRRALACTQILARDSFGLRLRAGMVPVSEVRRSGYQVKVAKYRVSANIDLAMFSGGGFGYSESQLKNPATSAAYLIPEEGTAEDRADAFRGLECRWEPVPSKKGEILTLIVKAIAADPGKDAAAYEQVLADVTQIFHPADSRPISDSQLNVATDARNLSAEARVRNFERPWIPKFVNVLRLKVIGYFGRIVFKRKASAQGIDWKRYKEDLIANTDSRKFDEVLRMILDGTAEQRQRLVAKLNEREKEGKIIYGLHIANEALLTCLVFNRVGNHVHFVDGSNGGYALAAKALKAKAAGRA